MISLYLQASKKAELIFYDDFKIPELNVSYSNGNLYYKTTM